MESLDFWPYHFLKLVYELLYLLLTFEFVSDVSKSEEGREVHVWAVYSYESPKMLHQRALLSGFVIILLLDRASH